MTKHHDRGQALVEFALVIPIVILLMAGLFDLGRLVFINNSLSDGARHGARQATTDVHAPDYCTRVDNAVRSAVRGQALNPYTVTLETVDGAGNVLSTYVVCQDGVDGAGKALIAGDSEVGPGDRITVNLETDVDLILGLVGQAVGQSSFHLHATSTMDVTFAPASP